ncbi:type III secretion system needle length determinant [Photobacterium damselae]|uniref:Type III secretion protein (YscP) n=2 Tax=Photobacterium damselae TaxID=38293 RepID=D0Z4W5_PHODD|nr:type III secretion system needle length determinant [Photobacterium damselae]EEZ39182.1 type III secretion protein (YscP) [Photobacterium damselae subsp. damselae CIP 102761]PSW81933.1 type III secretion system needle length determinant [Photobacterium damselae]SPY45099.1 type III secretion system needle length determinant [Photobacterium damselae]
MRVKNDHPNTTERPQQVQQRPVNQVSEELESRFNNALKPTQAESEHESATSRLFAAVLNADKLDGMKHKGKISSAIPATGKEQLEGSQEHPENLKDQPANEKSDADLHPEKPSHDLSERETVQVLDNKDQNEESHSETSERPAKEPHSDTAKPVKLHSLIEQSVGSKETDKSQPLASNSAAEKDSNNKQVSSVPLDNGSSRDPKIPMISLPNALKDQVLPIQTDQANLRNKTEPSTVQSVLQGQLHKLDAAAHKPDPAAKDTAAIVDSKAALSALEEKVKAVKHIELRHPSSESDAKLHPTANLSQSTAQGDIILKNVETHAPQNRAQDVNELINKLVDKIYVSLPSANDKEVRLLLNEGQLKGGEISIKQDSSGYSVLIKQEHALSLINQTAKQELTERLQRLGIDQPIRIAVSEQMNQQQDQQRSRQQRSIYDEWKPEDE